MTELFENEGKESNYDIPPRDGKKLKRKGVKEKKKLRALLLIFVSKETEGIAFGIIFQSSCKKICG